MRWHTAADASETDLAAIGAALTAAAVTTPVAIAGPAAPYFDVAKLPAPPVSGYPVRQPSDITCLCTWRGEDDDGFDALPVVPFDAAGSSDPDAAPSGYAWRFGDGETATGASVTRTYAKAGDYIATLEVADNFWSPVTASAAVPVKVTQGAAAPAAKKKRSKRARCLKKARRIKHKRQRAKAVKRCKKRDKEK